MTMSPPLVAHNGRAFSLADCPVLPIEDFRQAVVEGVAAGARIAALFAYPDGAGALRLLAALARVDQGDLAVVAAEVCGEYHAITPDCPQAQAFERDIFEQCGVRPLGHPWLKPLRCPRGKGDCPPYGCSLPRTVPAKGDCPLFPIRRGRFLLDGW